MSADSVRLLAPSELPDLEAGLENPTQRFEEKSLNYFNRIRTAHITMLATGILTSVGALAGGIFLVQQETAENRNDSIAGGIGVMFLSPIIACTTLQTVHSSFTFFLKRYRRDPLYVTKYHVETMKVDEFYKTYHRRLNEFQNSGLLGRASLRKIRLFWKERHQYFDDLIEFESRFPKEIVENNPRLKDAKEIVQSAVNLQEEDWETLRRELIADLPEFEPSQLPYLQEEARS